MANNVDLGIQLIRLKNKIAKHFGQSEWLELGTLVNQFELVNSHGRLLRSLSFGDPDYEGHVLSVLRTMVESDPANLAKMVAFVEAVSPDEEGENVSSQEPAGRKIVFAPTVFAVPDGDVENDLVSVMMPFNAALSSVFATIKDAATDAGMRCQRGDDIWDHSTVIQDLFNLIFKSYIVVCDFTGKNPNVFYEAGIAHTLGKHVIPLTQSADDIPFDLQHHRYLKYLNNTEGRATLRSQLAERIKTLAAKRPSKFPWQK
jgi:hypothetical protein